MKKIHPLQGGGGEDALREGFYVFLMEPQFLKKSS